MTNERTTKRKGDGVSINVREIVLAEMCWIAIGFYLGNKIHPFMGFVLALAFDSGYMYLILSALKDATLVIK